MSTPWIGRRARASPPMMATAPRDERLRNARVVPRAGANFFGMAASFNWPADNRSDTACVTRASAGVKGSVRNGRAWATGRTAGRARTGLIYCLTSLLVELSTATDLLGMGSLGSRVVGFESERKQVCLAKPPKGGVENASR